MGLNENVNEDVFTPFTRCARIFCYFGRSWLKEECLISARTNQRSLERREKCGYDAHTDREEEEKERERMEKNGKQAIIYQVSEVLIDAGGRES